MYVLIKSKATGDVTDYHNEIHEYERELFLQAGGDSERKLSTYSINKRE